MDDFIKNKKMKYINFHFNKIYFIFLFSIIIYTIREYMNQNTFINELNPLYKLFLMYSGESLSGFIYLYLKYSLNENEKGISTKIFNSIEGKFKSKIKELKIIYVAIFMGSMIDGISCYNYKYYFNRNMLKFKTIFYDLEILFLCIFLCLTESYYLNLPKYRHHYLGLVLIFISLLIVLFSNLLKIEINNIWNFILILINFIETKCLLSFLYSLEKIINYRYFVNIYKLLFLEGLSGIIVFIFIFGIYIIFDNNIFVDIINKLNSESLLYSFIYLILVLLFNLTKLKIIELKSPSYNIIPNLLRVILIDILINNRAFTIDFILYNIFSLLGAFIFCEVITLHFYDLDRNTIHETRERGKIDAIKTLFNQIELNDSLVIIEDLVKSTK